MKKKINYNCPNQNKSEHCVNNRGKEVLMNKVISHKEIRGLQDLKIDKVFTYKEENTTKMSQHLSQKFELSHLDSVIKRKTNSQTGCPSNFEQPIVV